MSFFGLLIISMIVGIGTLIVGAVLAESFLSLLDD
jgi:hypothetical protein